MVFDKVIQGEVLRTNTRGVGMTYEVARNKQCYYFAVFFGFLLLGGSIAIASLVIVESSGSDNKDYVSCNGTVVQSPDNNGLCFKDVDFCLIYRDMDEVDDFIESYFSSNISRTSNSWIDGIKCFQEFDKYVGICRTETESEIAYQWCLNLATQIFGYSSKLLESFKCEPSSNMINDRTLWGFSGEYNYKLWNLFPQSFTWGFILLAMVLFSSPRSIKRENDHFEIVTSAGCKSILPLEAVEKILLMGAYKPCIHENMMNNMCKCVVGGGLRGKQTVALITRSSCKHASWYFSFNDDQFQQFCSENLVNDMIPMGVIVGTNNMNIDVEFTK